MYYANQERRIKIGCLGKKMLILLGAGLALGLSGRPDQYFKIIKSAHKEWEKINRKGLERTIRKLYESKLINAIDNADGTTSVVLSNGGKQKILRFSLDELKLKRPDRWDRLWRIIIFDIPEKFKNARDLFANKLLKLGFRAIQRSVFVYPYDCKDEIDFVIEVLSIRRFVRIIIAKDIDTAIELKDKFGLH